LLTETPWQPFMINVMSQQVATIDMLKKDNEERKAREASARKEEDNTPILGGSRLMLTQGPMSMGAASPLPQHQTFGGAPGLQTNGIPPQPTGLRGF
jgi:clathrin heavy chain